MGSRAWRGSPPSLQASLRHDASLQEVHLPWVCLLRFSFCCCRHLIFVEKKRKRARSLF